MECCISRLWSWGQALASTIRVSGVTPWQSESLRKVSRGQDSLTSCQDRGPADWGRGGCPQGKDARGCCHFMPLYCLSYDLLSTQVLSLLTPPCWRKQERQASPWDSTGSPGASPTPWKYWATPQCHSWRAGQPRALTFNTGCTRDFQWMRVSFWSCENLGGQPRQSCTVSSPPHHRGVGKREGAWGFPHNTGGVRGSREEGAPHRLGIRHSREARSFSSALAPPALAPPLEGRPVSGGDRVTVCQRAGWEAASCQRRHTRAALEENVC